MSRQTKSINNFKFKKIFSIGDVFYSIKIINRHVSNKQFVYLSVYRQLDKPILTFAEFKKIGDANLIKLAESIIKRRPDIFRFFTHNQDDNFFDCYKLAFEKYYQHHFNKIAENITPMIKGFVNFSEIQNVVQSLEAWGKKVGQMFKQFAETCQIAEREAIIILHRYKWCITMSLPLPFIFKIVEVGRKKGNQRKAINELFIHYFSTNGYENLINLVEGWSANTLFKPRMKIIHDCLTVITKPARHLNPSNVVLPTLISQIEGIWNDMFEQKGMVLNSHSGRKSRIRKRNKHKKEWLKKIDDRENLSYLAIEVLCDILFQHSKPNKPLKNPFGFNRHKILHGEYIKYGTLGNTLRAILILDSLAYISNDISRYRNVSKVNI